MKKIAKPAMTGRESRNSMPLATTIRTTQSSRGRFVDRTSRDSESRARDVSVAHCENHCQARTPMTMKRT